MAAEKEDPQYQEWGVAIQTSRLRAGHIANGIVQLLRLVPDPPRFSPSAPRDGSRVGGYIREVVTELRRRFPERGWELPNVARALCVVRSKKGPVPLAPGPEAPSFVQEALKHLELLIAVTPAAPGLSSEMHGLVAGALNADGLVMESGGSDPTTPGLNFAGYTTTHTLKGMHAATFLGLLSRTDVGCGALVELHRLLAGLADPHNKLVETLGIGLGQTWNIGLRPSELRDCFPLPKGDEWDELAERAGEMAANLMAWSGRGMSKAQTLMSVVDLAALLLLLRLLRWRPSQLGAKSSLLLMVTPLELEVSHHGVIARAQQSLKAALANLDQAAIERNLVLEKTGKHNKVTVYWPSVHAQNIGAASGWLYPFDERGAPKRYLRPGSRQLTTLVQSLVGPGQDLSWADFAAKAQRLGLAIGGPNEAVVAGQLRLSGGAFSLHEAGRINRHHLVALGLARQESDNVVRVDGGLK